ncbi:MAG: hypothetical protein LBQ28_00845 [Prevotellaceae bacterium]|jgi:hypothetical protein|nr:hypothetical protein [Prevotellaceae bacterium]
MCVKLSKISLYCKDLQIPCLKYFEKNISDIFTCLVKVCHTCIATFTRLVKVSPTPLAWFHLIGESSAKSRTWFHLIGESSAEASLPFSPAWRLGNNEMHINKKH